MPEDSLSDLFALFSHRSTDARRSGVSRRTVLGAAWSAPVIVAAVAAPLAAASTGRPDASLFWSEADGIQGQSSLLTLMVPSGSPGIGSTATIVLQLTPYGNIPETIGSGRWTYTPNFGAYSATLTSPVGGVTGGTRGFTIDEWGELSGPYTVVATYTNDKEPGSLTATIRVGFGPEPTLEWLTDPAEFGTTTTLRLTVPPESYAIGRRGLLADLNQFPPPNQTPPFPAGTTVMKAPGWTDYVDPDQGVKAFQLDPLTEGVHDFVYTLGAGTAAVTPSTILIVGKGVPPQAPLRIVPA
ncbi:hypothetical protein [Herbiconiux flava]|uniref:Uncharacterized protein n=1 Tax=Herbiconiux flava TaxID=881268 RepID=A0A852SP83_9MICO|nr:hypothetical protein [Herbiconiux flava]NYD70617.1 hypothetical protein [Herbiconiux flava]GLK17374.1 hypothetical protein GCM10017602_18560 [Herbiconiux flava]